MINMQKEQIYLKNQESVLLLSDCKYIEALNILKPLIESFNQSHAPSIEEVITLNNLAQIHYKLNQPYFSLKYISRASTFIPTTVSEMLCKIGTYLNSSVINSNLGYYTSAIQEGYKALELINQEKQPETAVIIYFNMATLFLTLKKHKKVAQFFKDAVILAESSLGPHHILTRKVTKACSDYFYKPKGQNYFKNISISSKTISLSHKPRQSEKTLIKVLNLYPEKKIQKHKIISDIMSVDKINNKKQLEGSGPIIKDIKKTSNFDMKLSNTPKTIRRKYIDNVISSRSTAISSIGNSFAGKNNSLVEGRMKNISQYLLSLQNEINDFTCNSKTIMKRAQLDNVTERSEKNNSPEVVNSLILKSTFGIKSIL